MILEGRTAVVTGSTGRLGSSITMALARAGCNCVCHYHRNHSKAEEMVCRIRGLGLKSTAVAGDLGESGKIEELFDKAAGVGTPSILVNSAAIFARQHLADVSFAEAQRILGLNLTASILTSSKFAQILAGKPASGTGPEGKIINVADVGGIRPWAEYVVYCSSKAGLIGATKALAKELAPGIQVNSVAPGVVTWPEEFGETLKERQVSFIPAGRIAEPKDVTEAILFLLRNDYMTGEVLAVDGGRSM